MRKKLLLKEEVHQSNSLQNLEAIDGYSTLNKEFENNELEQNNELEHEIECPRCYGIMTSSSVFGNRVAYFCNECINSLNLC
jgi:formamidopyrimidine-DNA glycosylase